ncbi:MAG: TM2 domain-containing protein [Treponemataceae bacterium]|nr:TM2 domain-containing protein [Treponemataceae bacterium]
MFCRNCGKEFEDGTKFCPACGTAVETGTQTPRMAQGHGGGRSHKSRTAAALLAFFFGGLGIHYFYVGKYGTGVMQIVLTCCYCIGAIWALIDPSLLLVISLRGLVVSEIWAVIDLIIILCGNFTDSKGKRITEWNATY